MDDVRKTKTKRQEGGGLGACETYKYQNRRKLQVKGNKYLIRNELPVYDFTRLSALENFMCVADSSIDNNSFSCRSSFFLEKSVAHIHVPTWYWYSTILSAKIISFFIKFWNRLYFATHKNLCFKFTVTQKSP